MGNFYVNLAVRSDDQDQIASHVPKGDPSVLGPVVNGWTVLSSERLETQDEDILKDYGRRLSKAMNVPVIGTLNHDDDVLLVMLFHEGDLVSNYNSDPEYWTDGDGPPLIEGIAAFAEILDVDAGQLTALLSTRPVFAVERHGELANLIGLPDYAAGFGHDDAKRDEFPHLDLRFSE